MPVHIYNSPTKHKDQKISEAPYATKKYEILSTTHKMQTLLS